MVFMARHKIIWNNFEQALLGPKGEGQDARNNLQLSVITVFYLAVNI